MSELEHTPEPWIVSVSSIDGIPLVYAEETKGDKTIIAELIRIHKWNLEKNKKEMMANAELIKNSPVMYNFIKRLANAGSSLNVLDMVEEAEKILKEMM